MSDKIDIKRVRELVELQWEIIDAGRIDFKNYLRRCARDDVPVNDDELSTLLRDVQIRNQQAMGLLGIVANFSEDLK